MAGNSRAKIRCTSSKVAYAPPGPSMQLVGASIRRSDAPTLSPARPGRGSMREIPPEAEPELGNERGIGLDSSACRNRSRHIRRATSKPRRARPPRADDVDDRSQPRQIVLQRPPRPARGAVWPFCVSTENLARVAHLYLRGCRRRPDRAARVRRATFARASGSCPVLRDIGASPPAVRRRHGPCTGDAGAEVDGVGERLPIDGVRDRAAAGRRAAARRRGSAAIHPT